MAAQHTPGPWHAKRRDWSSRFYVDAQDGGICVPCYGRDTRPDGVDEANARLIAAAPDLLAALDELLAHYVRLASSGDCGNWDAENEPQVIAARAAIAKAEGR